MEVVENKRADLQQSLAGERRGVLPPPAIRMVIKTIELQNLIVVSVEKQECQRAKGVEGGGVQRRLVRMQSSPSMLGVKTRGS